jgi:aspartate/methionine/tyrosine aminotransferase
MPKQLGIRELAEKAKAEGAYDLAQGVIDADLPTSLVGSFNQISLANTSRYDNKRGVLIYREAVVGYLQSRDWRVSLDSVMSVAGAMAGITTALLTELKPGAKVLLPEPFFVYHKLLLETLGFKVEYLPTKLGEDLDWKEVENRMNEADAIIITTPANPTGQVASATTLQQLSKTAKEKKCLLVLDEMYREFIWDEKERNDSEYANLDLSKTVVVRSWSKTFAIPGWRIGFVVTSPDRIEAMAVRHDALYIGGSTIAQNAMAEALNEHLDELDQYVDNLRNTLLQNKEILEKAFTEYGLTPLPITATYYTLLKHDRNTDIAMVEELITKKIVATPANILFNDSTKETGYIRIHFAVASGVAEKVATILEK